MQGQRDLATVSRLIMSRADAAGDRPARRLLPRRARRRTTARPRAAPHRQLRLQEAQERLEPLQAGRGRSSARRRSRSKPILVTEAPDDYVHDRLGAGRGRRRVNIIVLPVLFEEQVLARHRARRRSSRSPRSTSLPRAAHGDDRRRAQRRSSPTCAPRSCSSSRSRSPRSCSRSPRSSSRSRRSCKRSNAELEEQAKSLKASEELLQTQQEELQQTNEELQEKAALLVAAEPRHRDQEPRDRAGARVARGARRAARAVARSTSASSWRTCRTSCARRSTRC